MLRGWVLGAPFATGSGCSRLRQMSLVLQDPIVSEVAPVSKYAGAEVHHQEYLARGGRFGKAQNPAKGCSDPIRCYG